MKKIAIIPARAGSKGLRDKNIIDLCGKPLISYSIEAAIKSNEFDRIIVSTDSKEYGEISIRYGAEVLYRGENLSNDNASTYVVIEDLLRRIDEPFEYFMLLQPTSPLRDEKHICDAIHIFEENLDKFDFLVSVKEAEHGKVLVNTIDEDGSLKNFDTDFSCYKRQIHKDYSPNGAIFIAKPDAYLEQKHFFGEKSLAFKMNKVDSVDIDDVLDYEIAKICIKKKLGLWEEVR